MKWPILLLCFACLVSCHDDDVDCGVANPEELGWFKVNVDALNLSGELSKYLYFMQGEFKGQQVYISGNCCPYCSSVATIFDCAGNQLGLLGVGEGAINPDDIKNQSVAWKSDDNVCMF